MGRLYGKVRITSEPNSNSLIITANSKESLAAVENVIEQLDRPSEAGESTLRVGLKFAKAFTVANNINILFAKGGSPLLRPLAQPGQQPVPQQQQQQSSSSRSGFDLEQELKEEGYYPWLGGQPDNIRTSDGRTASRPVSDLVGRVRAVPDRRTIHTERNLRRYVFGVDGFFNMFNTDWRWNAYAEHGETDCHRAVLRQFLADFARYRFASVDPGAGIVLGKRGTELRHDLV